MRIVDIRSETTQSRRGRDSNLEITSDLISSKHPTNNPRQDQYKSLIDKIIKNKTVLCQTKVWNRAKLRKMKITIVIDLRSPIKITNSNLE